MSDSLPVRTADATARQSLAAELGSVLDGEVRFGAGDRALYATDSSNYRQTPIGVVLPRHNEDVERTVAICRRHGAPILARGGGTSLAGQCCNAAVIIDCSRHLDSILEIQAPAGDRASVGLARVQPGVILDDLRTAAEQYHRTFAPDPATHDRCTLGGMIGNNSCGVHSVMAGKTDANVEQLEILTYDGLRLSVGATSEDELGAIVSAGGRRGEIYGALRSLRDQYGDLIRSRFPRIPRLVSGYGLDHLLPENGFHVARALVGTEGTCVTVLEATVRLVPSPPYRSLLVLGYPDVATACEYVPAIGAGGPIGLEGFDDRLVEDMRRSRLHAGGRALLPPGGGWLLVEFGGETPADAENRARALMALTVDLGMPTSRLFTDLRSGQEVWQMRESAVGATSYVPGRPLQLPGWEDSAVPPDRLGSYLRQLRALLDRYGYDGAFYGHFGQGCVHTRIDFDLMSASGIATFRAFLDEAADLVVAHGGSLSGEHGDGQARAALLPKMFGPELVTAFQEFKRIWDPENKMNPGKVVSPYLPDEHLRLQAHAQIARSDTHFAFPDDERNFAHAMLRCVGIGKCRRHDGGTMCPSYMVTREEQHSTRGRARLLFEMLQGDTLTGGWRSREVRDALDLCLSCKGCKHDCPTGVDIASYKAEFLAHYYAGRLRPRSAYALGLIYWWARAGALAPRLANALMQSPVGGAAVRRLGGIAPQRTLPRLAEQTFRAWFADRRPAGPGAPQVVLWPDTFSNFFHPEVARAAVSVLEAAGFEIVLPSRPLCCGRPLYDYGFLSLARRLLRQNLTILEPHLAEGTPIVVLEPSCAAVFRDELINLLADDSRAHRLRSQTFLLAEFLRQYAPAFRYPAIDRKAAVHGHCHQSAIGGPATDQILLTAMGVEATVLDAGCCGMAGAFGFEKEHYDVSVACGERVLLPAVRAAGADTLLLADGFSCREQIGQLTERRALHLAEVIANGLTGSE